MAMTDHKTTDQSVMAHIEALVTEEHKLYAHGSPSEADRERLKKIGVELDRFWDLLRQRRGLREFGRNPDEAQVRPASVVEHYRDEET
jgi:hypothetical protein